MEQRPADGVSKTALGVGVLRALHRVVDSEPWVIDDPVSTLLFGDAARARLNRDFAAGLGDAGANALRGHVLVRSAFAEERLRQAVARGVRHCVVLGAGFDTFAYRQPAWMRGVRLFEVDAPATQAEKRARLAAAGIAEPRNVVYAAIDFERTPLAAGLRDAGLDLDAPAFFSWLGVMVYLSRDAVDAVFRTVAAMPPGSEIAFTFAQGGDADRPAKGVTEISKRVAELSKRVAELGKRVAELGEPLRTTITVAELETLLARHGFREHTILSTAGAQRYLGTRTDALRLPPRESIAAAIM
jgi:methyltransferase (TIGR00027 family)